MDTRDLYPHEILQEAIGKSCAKSEFSIKMLVILSFFRRRLCRLRLSCLPARHQRHSGRMERPGRPFRCVRVPDCTDLYLNRWRRAGNRQYDDYGFGQIDRPCQHLQTGTQLAHRQLGQSGWRRCHGLFLGHYVGLAEGAAAAKTIAIAEAKVNMDFGRAFVSAIACNWMVCMGIWFYFGSRHTSGRILATWFPVMIFVLIGFQHFVANMFIIPAGIWAGANVSWGQFFYNMIPVFLGNVLGGSSFVCRLLSFRL